MKPAFICVSCGAIYPPDVIEQWGRKYGHNLGCVPCCEAMRSDYTKPIAFEPAHPERAHHPLFVCKGQLQMTSVNDDVKMTYPKAIDDPDMNLRMPIIIEQQKEKSQTLKAHLANVANNKPKDVIENW